MPKQTTLAESSDVFLESLQLSQFTKSQLEALIYRHGYWLLQTIIIFFDLIAKEVGIVLLGTFWGTGAPRLLHYGQGRCHGGLGGRG